MKLDEVMEVDKDTEAETRRKYIDLDLAEAGWTIGKGLSYRSASYRYAKQYRKRLCRLCFIQQ